VTGERQLIFAIGMGGGMGMGGMRFTIDGRMFDPGRDDQTVALGAIEEWTVVNTSPMDHPFHLHAWPFHVLDAGGGAPPSGVRQDIVLVPARGQVRLTRTARPWSAAAVAAEAARVGHRARR
jgi:FtsP/CotA-like multicopper oxidase with cupredoxin domain